jgi:hypothetical protein
MSATSDTANPTTVLIELAVAAENARSLQVILDRLTKRPVEPITYVDLERQDDAEYDRECR